MMHSYQDIGEHAEIYICYAPQEVTMMSNSLNNRAINR